MFSPNIEEIVPETSDSFSLGDTMKLGLVYFTTRSPNTKDTSETRAT